MVTFYSTHCPKCNILKKKLEQANIPYVENNDIDEMLGRGLTMAPVIEVDGVIYDFKQAVEWIRGQERGRL